MPYDSPEKQAAWQKENRQYLTAYNRRWRAAKRSDPEWRANEIAVRAKGCKRFRLNPTNRLITNLRNRVNAALKGRSKSAATRALLGISVAGFKQYLQDAFLPGMTWENYGEWHVDHKRPCAAFDFSDPNEQKACFHYTNLQPLWAVDNRRKGKYA